ncbi:MAG: trypsin-like peptidase domain-containing protein [Acidobacterium ailaaui]|nr:trypsin-like peptidase domain-containing protein [Pseudacidobacterium ailaaui]
MNLLKKIFPLALYALALSAATCGFLAMAANPTPRNSTLLLLSTHPQNDERFGAAYALFHATGFVALDGYGHEVIVTAEHVHTSVGEYIYGYSQYTGGWLKGKYLRSGKGDLAIYLIVESQLKKPAPVKFDCHPDFQPGHKLESWGYPVRLGGRQSYGITSGTDRVDIGGYAAPVVALPVLPGQSGSPVWTQNHRVIGMVIQYLPTALGNAILESSEDICDTLH